MNNDEPGLIALMQSDDHMAFQQLYYRYYDDLFAYLYTLLHCRHEAEEILQDVYVSLWENRCRLHNVSSVNAFLRVTARNKALNVIRRQRLMPALEEYSSSTDAYEVSHTDCSQLEYADFEKLMMGFINALPASQRRVIMLSRFEDKSHKKICQSLNLSLQTVKNNLSLALRTLRLNLESADSDERQYILGGG